VVRRGRLAPGGGDLAWVAASLVVLAASLYYAAASEIPDTGFTLMPSTWEVIDVDRCPPAESCPQVGDRVLAIDGLTLEQFRRDRSLELLAPFAGDGRAELRLLRDGTPQTLAVRLRTELGPPLAQALLIGLLPLTFWLMGTTLVVFLRPRDERWLALVLFSYVTASMLASGLASARHADGAAVVFHVVVWLFLPVAVHLHLLLPSPLLGHRRWALLAPLYAVSLLLVALDAKGLLAAFDYLSELSFAAGVTLSLALLGLRLLLPAAAADRVASRIMAFGVAVSFAPVFLSFVVLPLVTAERDLLAAGGGLLEMSVLAVTLLAIPMLPLSYLYAIYKHRLSALEFRANRLLGIFGFLALTVPLYVVTLVYLRHRFSIVMLVLSVTLVAAAPALRARFQALVDRRVFGIRHTHAEVVELVAARIPAAFDRASLARAVRDEIMPTLLIRQSALYLFEGETVTALYEQAAPAGEGPPGAAAVRGLLARAGSYLPPVRALPAARFAWVRLVLPIAVQGEVIGAWLLGRRDPDDHYPAGDIQLLATVANQIASMVENIRLYEQAQQEIAQRKAAEEETRRSHLQLLHAQKMEAIGRLASGVAHDFNNYLLVILGYTDLLLSEHGDDAALGPRLSAIYEAGKKATTLTRDLLTFARRQPMEAEVVDLNDVVGSVEKMLRRLLGDDVRLETELHPRLGKVRIDPGRMEHILLNMAVNARHAMPHGGRFTLRTAPLAVRPGARPPHADLPAGRYVLLTVADTGSGMDAATQARVFEPFFTTRQHGEGTGLGLSTAYGIVKQSGGHIAVDSAPGEGARFSIYLPEVDEEDEIGSAEGPAAVDGR
jgi:signal transduction histidine kinase